MAVSADDKEVDVSDSGNHRIQRFNSSGVYIDAFGSLGSDLGQFSTPKGLAFSETELFIVDSGNNRLVTAQNGHAVGTIGAVGSALGQFQTPVNLGFDGRGIYIADTGNGRIQKLDAGTGGHFDWDKFEPLWGISTELGLSLPNAVVPAGNLLEERIYIADTGHNRVLVVRLPSPDPLPVWNDTRQRLINGDIEGALVNFSDRSVARYRQAWQVIGNANLSLMINDIGTLSPIFISRDRAQYRFQQTIQGVSLTFIVEFAWEEGKWKVLDF